MAEIDSGQLHKNENGDAAFNVAIIELVDRIRESVTTLEKSRKADEYAPGYIQTRVQSELLRGGKWLGCGDNDISSVPSTRRTGL